jgi:hypothetical protein
MEEDNKKEQKRGPLTQDEYMAEVYKSRQLLRVEIKRFMEEETGDTYEADADLFAIFHTFTRAQQETINGKIALFHKFSGQQ